MTNGKEHRYAVEIRWTGNKGEGTRNYRSYERSHEIVSGGKPMIGGSSDPAFRGDADLWNPEDLMVAAASACHKLTYLSLCARAGVNVIAYTDHAVGVMVEYPEGGGRFENITLNPKVTVTADSDLAKAVALHHDAHERCFIANSVNFAIECEASVEQRPD